MNENGYGGQQYSNGYDQQYGGQQYSNGYDQQFDNSYYSTPQVNLPEGMMERMPEGLRNKIEDAMAMAEADNQNAKYENAESPTLTAQMKPGPAIAALIIGFGGMILFLQTVPGIAILCLGIMLVIFGIGLVSDEKFNFRRHAKSTLVMMIGIGMVLMSLYCLLAKMIPELPQPRLVVMMGISFAAVGALLLILSCITYQYLNEVCTEPVQAICVYMKQKEEYKDGHTYIKYAPVYEYQFRGNTYCAAEDYGSKKGASIGSRHELYINPYQPTTFNKKNGQSIVGIVAFSMIFILAGFFMCCIP